jgi:hypothetical protein
MFQQIHMQNQLLLHWGHEIELEVYQIQHVDPMPIITKAFSLHSHLQNLLESVENL